jgi:hypothetical protein
MIFRRWRFLHFACNVFRRIRSGRGGIIVLAKQNSETAIMKTAINIVLLMVAGTTLVTASHGPFVERQVLGYTVRLVAGPPPGVTNYLVRESPPFGQPGTISDGGSYDPATGTILFGPFEDGENRVLTYTDLPPLGSWGRFGFTGEAVANGTSSAVVGDDYTEIPYFHSPPLEARLLLRWRPLSQQVALQRIGGGGAPWFLLASSNLQDWSYVGDLGNVFQGFELVDAGASSQACRFYRAQNIPTPDPVKLAWIAPGTFTMGSPAGEVDRDPDEGPQTLVTLTRGFFMGRYEVTQGEYLAVMGNNPSIFSTNNGFAEDPSRPVESVSWDNATAYCAALTQRERLAGRIGTNAVYRLPTEAEWEYACRGWTSTRFSYGDDIGYTNLTNYAWYHDNCGGRTHPVGQKLPNLWGLYDMHGNVWEWCQD